MRKRLFIAANIPEGIKKEISSRILEKIPGAGLKVVRWENLHITLKFLGYVPEGEIEGIKKAMEGVSGSGKFAVKISGIGQFGGRIIWLGLEDRGRLKQIAGILNEHIKIGDERFSAHLTLARNKTLKAGDFEKALGKVAGEAFSAETGVKSIELMESLLGPKGPEYRAIFSVGL